jgi:hypothetical protein
VGRAIRSEWWGVPLTSLDISKTRVPVFFWHQSGHYFFHCGDSFFLGNDRKKQLLAGTNDPGHAWSMMAWVVVVVGMRVNIANVCPLFGMCGGFGTASSQKCSTTPVVIHWCHQLMEVVAIYHGNEFDIGYDWIILHVWQR